MCVCVFVYVCVRDPTCLVFWKGYVNLRKANPLSKNLHLLQRSNVWIKKVIEICPQIVNTVGEVPEAAGKIKMGAAIYQEGSPGDLHVGPTYRSITPGAGWTYVYVCIVLHCTVLYCIVLCCLVLYVLYCIVLYCIVLYCIVLYCMH